MTKTCGECSWFSEGGNRCKLFINQYIFGDRSACNNFVPKPEAPKPTNGDRIRQGGDEALMLFKKKHKCDCCVYIHNGNCTEPVDRKDRCSDGLKQWLNAPADAPDTNVGKMEE